MKVLCEQHWLVKDGVRLAKAHFLSPLYTLSIRAQAALAVNGTDLNSFIQVAPENDLQSVIDVLSVYL
jgi:DNA polymerase II small subunit/DNA polymerase delta subunit B